MTATVFYDSARIAGAALVFYDILYSRSMTRWLDEAPANLPCTRCEKVKPVSDFPVRTARGRKQYWSYCRDCYNAYTRERWAENIEVNREKHRDYYKNNKDRILANQHRVYDPVKSWAQKISRDYGISQDEYQALFLAQEGVCAICGNPSRGKRMLSVDHDHETGRVRGLLCTTCNVGLGALRDSPELLRAALSYLEKKVMS